VGNERALRATRVLGLDPVLRTTPSVQAALDVLRADAQRADGSPGSSP
jgi:hypothetical protein